MVKIETSVNLARKVRLHAVRMVNKGGSSHIGSVLSIADILAVLYNNILSFRPNDTKWDKRDRFILSKGHAGAGVYAVLAESGFFRTDKLLEHYQDGSVFSGHVSHRGVPGVELSTGSLGHGLPVGAGMAYAAKIDNKNHRVFVLMSDGELNEGSNWEALMFSAHHKLNNLVAIIDRNHLQSMKSTEETLALEPLADKFKSFGWHVSVIDGHDHDKLTDTLNRKYTTPHIVIANTIKGKGVSFMEDQVVWHYKTPEGELFDQAIRELESQ
ncbi:MAG TPA: transketolase [Gammaproteobacteria bacterium]|nr:transketolase [Gammaproteobacteria bacterium]